MVALLVPGCYEPYRPHIQEATLESSSLDWFERRLAQQSDGWLDRKTVETRYTYIPEGDGPPFAGVIQVFGLRQQDRMGTQALLELTRILVERSAEEHGITFDPDASDEGQRQNAAGASTRYFTLEGTVQTSEGLFPSNVGIRILGEVWHDGKSKTSVIVVAMAQVTQDRPILGPLEDETTWWEIAGDPEATLVSPPTQRGLVDHVQSH